jgi:lipopolysaccharide heptosyltransferase II
LSATDPGVLRIRARLRAATGSLNRFALRSALRLLAPRVPGPIPSEGVRRILLSGSMGIGNAVMFEPVLRALRDRFPAAHLAVTLDADAASRAVFGWPGLVDEVIVVRGSSRLTRAIAGLRLARQGWDLCVVRFNGATHEVVVAAIFGRIPYRVGHVSGGRFSSQLDWLFNLPVVMGDYDHEVDRYLALAEKLGHVPSRRAPRLAVPDEDRATAQRLTRDLGLAPDRPWVAIQPGSSAHQHWKRWPPEHWRTLASGLTAAGLAVLGLGSADERDLLAEICRGTGAVNLAGSCSLQVAAAVLERSQLLVSTDSALTHIAGAVGTPVIGIFGPTDRTRTRPYGTGHTLLVPVDCRGNREPCLAPSGVLSPDCTWRECMRSIRPEEVVAAVRARVAAPAHGGAVRPPAGRFTLGEMA